MDPFTAILSAAAASGTTSLLGNLLGNKGSSGQTGANVVNFNDPQDAQNRASSEAYMQDVLNGLRAGKVPDWMNRFTDPLQADLLRQNQQQFFGKPGNYGGSVMDIAQSTGAMSGLGGQTGQAPVNKALSDYADRMSGINQYIASLKNNYMQQASQTVPQQLNSMSTQKNSLVPFNVPGSPSQNPLAGASQALGAVDWSKLNFGGGAATQPSTVMPQSNYGLPSGNNALSSLFPYTGSQYGQTQVVPQSTNNTALNSLFPYTMGGR